MRSIPCGLGLYQLLVFWIEEMDHGGCTLTRRAERLSRLTVQKSASPSRMDQSFSWRFLWVLLPRWILWPLLSFFAHHCMSSHAWTLKQWQWSTGTDGLRSTSFFQLGSPNGTSLPSSLQGESYACNFLVAISVLVSRTSEAVFQLREVSKSSLVTASARQNIFMRFLHSISVTRMEI